MGVGGDWGVPPTHVHMHVHARTHTHAHACVANMIIPCKWLPPLDLGKSQGFPMMSYVCAHACVHARACAHVWGGPCHHPHPHPPTAHPPEWGTPGISQNSIALELIEIFQFCLKSVETFPPMGGCIISWVAGWVCGFMGGVRSNH